MPKLPMKHPPPPHTHKTMSLSGGHLALVGSINAPGVHSAWDMVRGQIRFMMCQCHERQEYEARLLPSHSSQPSWGNKLCVYGLVGNPREPQPGKTWSRRCHSFWEFTGATGSPSVVVINTVFSGLINSNWIISSTKKGTSGHHVW